VDYAAVGRDFKEDVKMFERSFVDLCRKSRREKKPILIFMMRDNNDQTYNYARRALSDETVQELIRQSYNVFGMYANNINPLLARQIQFP
jgi:hypothetical protein